MSILVKDMKMPENCGVCDFLNEYGQCQRLKKIVHKTVCINNGRLIDCPLHELQPHGRLIDADALLQHEVAIPSDGGYLRVIYSSYVRNAPTIIEAEEENG